MTATEKVQEIIHRGLLSAYVERVGDDELSRRLLEHFVNLGEDALHVMDNLVNASLEQEIEYLERGDLSQEELSIEDFISQTRELPPIEEEAEPSVEEREEVVNLTEELQQKIRQILIDVRNHGLTGGVRRRQQLQSVYSYMTANYIRNASDNNIIREDGDHPLSEEEIVRLVIAHEYGMDTFKSQPFKRPFRVALRAELKRFEEEQERLAEERRERRRNGRRNGNNRNSS